jgi:hypothetical protein
MARKSVKTSTLRSLLSKCGNVCAFPGCTSEVFNGNHKLVAQICHIEAAEPGGERYNHSSDDEQRRSFDNLIVLCGKHHIETNDVIKYSVSKLLKMKNTHEKKFGKKPFKLDESYLFTLINESDIYWQKIDRFQKKDLGRSNPIKINTTLNTYTLNKIIDKLNEELFELVEELIDLSKDSDFLLSGRSWEIYNLFIPSLKNLIKLTIAHSKVKSLEDYMKTNSDDNLSKSQLKQAKKELKDVIREKAFFYD